VQCVVKCQQCGENVTPIVETLEHVSDPDDPDSSYYLTGRIKINVL